ncbi:hypothetical protein [Pseudomonas sp. GL-B-19]|uniref:hypothetical protein n=1 Tax=Pseudomonas sp. GL-B-19 TaxID=2832393 RepID=UPI001CBC36F8|nr:hypothetical protein [Pseudomonas sp. GL-B-19]
MIKPKSRITNPMTIIAVFATLSETSAAISLPFLDNDERKIYIWFLISFPFYLLFLFFATLNFNYRSLYAPSDFEKGKHFIKVMANADQSESFAPTDSTKHWIEHQVRLPALLKDLHIVDVRRMSKKMEFNTLIEKVQAPQAPSARLIVFLTCTDSEALLKESALKYSKQTRKRSHTAFWVAYNVSSQGVTTMA